MDGILDIAFRSDVNFASSLLNVEILSLMLPRSHCLAALGNYSSDASGDESGDVISYSND